MVWSSINRADVICFLSSLPLLTPATTAVFVSYLPSLHSCLRLYRRCGLAYPYDGERFLRAQKEDDRETFSLQSSLGLIVWIVRCLTITRIWALFNSSIKGIVSRDRFGFWWHVWLALGRDMFCALSFKFELAGSASPLQIIMALWLTSIFKKGAKQPLHNLQWAATHDQITQQNSWRALKPVRHCVAWFRGQYLIYAFLKAKVTAR